MKARDIMTPNVETVTPETTVSDIARILIERHISGVPVVEDGAVIGVVSEGDLIHRHEIGTERRRSSWWLRLFASDQSPLDFMKTHGTLARDVMTSPAITIGDDTPLNEIADLFESKRIKRVPVLRDGQLVGIISRANLLRAFAMAPPVEKGGAHDDEEIRATLLSMLESQSWWRHRTSQVIVAEGVVHFWGMDGSADERDAARVAAMNVPGVQGVEDHRVALGALPGAE